MSLAAGGLLLLQLLVRGWHVGHSYYFQDDLGHLNLARSLGLSEEYLVRDYNGHLEVGQYFLIWALSHFMDDTFTVPTISVLVLQAGVSVMLWLVLRQLFGTSPLLLVPYAVYLFTPLALIWSSWWAAAVQTLPLQLFTLLAIWGAVRLARDGHRWGGVVSLAAQAGALFFWEKGAFVLPAVAAVCFLVVATGTARERLRWFAGEPRFWTGQVAILVGYALIYASVVSSPVEAETGSVEWLRYLGDMLLRTLVPGLFGGPWHGEGAMDNIYPLTSDLMAGIFLVLLLGAVALSLQVTGRMAWAGWILAAGYVAADVVLLALGRADFLGFLGRDPRYVADALPLVAIGLAAAFRGAYDPTTPTGQRLASQRSLLPVSVAAALALLVSGMVTQQAMSGAVRHTPVKEYVTKMLAGIESDPEASIIDGEVPYTLSARTTVAELINAVGAEAVIDEPGERLWQVDATGALRRAEIRDGLRQEAPEGECLKRIGDDPVDLMGWSHPMTRVHLLRVEYTTRAPGSLALSLGDWQKTATIRGGEAATYFVMPELQGPVMARQGGGDPICVTAIEVGDPQLL